jgi:mannosyltransferase
VTRPEQSMSRTVTQEADVAYEVIQLPGRGGQSRLLNLASAVSRRTDWTLIPAPVLTLAMMLWGIGARSYWGDEIDTISAVSRTVPQLMRLLGRIDAVHGLYYLLLMPVVALAGPGEVAARFPSALSMAAAAAGVTAIGRRLSSRRAGLLAGLLFAVLPEVTVQGQDARPYAMVTAAAVLASYLLVRAAGEPRPLWFAGYGLSLVAVGYLQLFGLLLVPAHAITLIVLRRRQQAPEDAAVLRRWLLTVAAAGLAVAPVTIAGWLQRNQIAWIPAPGWQDAGNVASTLIAGTTAAAIAIGLLMLLGAIRPDRWAAAPRGQRLTRGWLRSGGPDGGLAWLAVPWLVLPAGLLLAASAIKPVYFGRYITFSLPAVALLAGAGLAAIRWWAAACALVLVVALVAPAQLAQRAPNGGIRAVAQFLRTHEQPGDAIVYPESLIPPWYLSYPDGFVQLRDIGMSQTPAQAGRLYGGTVPVGELKQREKGVRRIWIVPEAGGGNPATYLAPGFRLAHVWHLSGNQPVLLYVNDTAGQ